MDFIYLDHAATSPLHRKVTKAMYPIYEQVFGNASSVHSYGREARRYLDEARRTMAEAIHANEKEIIFTSGGTEADNLALIGTATANRDKGNHIITTEQEHHAILHAAHHLEELDFEVTYLPVYEDGQIKVSDLEHALRDDTILVSIIYANNETGILQPIKQISAVLKGHQAYFHTDAVQAFGLLDIDVKMMNIDLLTVSSHKMNGPKGIGFLYVSDGVRIHPLQFGGEQERSRRAGTENIANAVGFQAAVELAMEKREYRLKKYQQLKHKFLALLTAHDITYEVNGNEKNAIASIVNISFSGANVESLLTNFDLEGIAASSGSACTAGSVEPSHVLLAMFGVDNDRTKNSIRFSFGINNTEENVEEAAHRIIKIVKRLTN